MNICSLINTTISSNTATYGGGVYLLNSNFFIQSSFILNNTAYIGGGIRYVDKIP